MTEAPSPVIDTKPTDDKARPKGFARVLGFFDTATKAIVTITGLVVAIGGAWAAIHHFGSDGADTPAIQPTVDPAAHIESCEHTHNMTSQHQKVTVTIGTDGIATCAWPAPSYADQDGFSVISFTLDADVPGAIEATDNTELDTFTGSCPSFRLTYEAKSQGTADHPVPVTVRPGMITWMNNPGLAYPGDGLNQLTPPDGNQVKFLNNTKEEFADANCGT